MKGRRWEQKQAGARKKAGANRACTEVTALGGKSWDNSRVILGHGAWQLFSYRTQRKEKYQGWLRFPGCLMGKWHWQWPKGVNWGKLVWRKVGRKGQSKIVQLGSNVHSSTQHWCTGVSPGLLILLSNLPEPRLPLFSNGNSTSTWESQTQHTAPVCSKYSVHEGDHGYQFVIVGCHPSDSAVPH